MSKNYGYEEEEKSQDFDKLDDDEIARPLTRNYAT